MDNDENRIFPFKESMGALMVALDRYNSFLTDHCDNIEDPEEKMKKAQQGKKEAMEFFKFFTDKIGVKVEEKEKKEIDGSNKNVIEVNTTKNGNMQQNTNIININDDNFEEFQKEDKKEEDNNIKVNNQFTPIQGKIYSVEEMENIVGKMEQKDEMSIADWEKYINEDNSKKTTKKKKKKKNKKKNNTTENTKESKKEFFQEEKKYNVEELSDNDDDVEEFKKDITENTVHAKDVKKIKPNISEEWIKSLENIGKKKDNNIAK